LICFTKYLFYKNPISSLFYTQNWLNYDYGDNSRSDEIQNEHTPQITAFWDVMSCRVVQASWNVMTHAQKPDFVFRRNGRVHLNRRGHQFSRLLAAEVCAISGSNAGYTMFRGSVKSTGYPLHSSFFSSLPVRCVTVCHHIQLESIYPSTWHNIWEDWCFISTDVRNWNLAKESLRLQKVGLPYVKADVTCCCYRHVQTQRTLTFYFWLRAPQTEINIIFSKEFYIT